MRIATIVDDGRARLSVVRDDRLLPLELPDGPMSLRELAAAGPERWRRAATWADAQPGAAWRPVEAATFGPAVPDPGAIYTIGHNYRTPEDDASDASDASRSTRPLVYGKAVTAVGAHGATLAWDRNVTDDVDAECELGVVIGPAAFAVDAAEAARHVFGYTIINDISARDACLDGDQWLIGKSMPGFCPVGPWIVTADEIDPRDLQLGCTINDAAIQDGRTAQMRSSIPELIAYLSRHVRLAPGDLIATGTPTRLAAPPGPGRRLRPGDEVTAWIEGIGALTTRIA